jgi:hypothetical protein
MCEKPKHPEYQANFERAFTMIKEMRQIVRNGDFTKTRRKRWSTNVNLTEIMVLHRRAEALRKQPAQIAELLNQLESIVSSVKAGESSPREAWVFVNKTSLFLRRTQSSFYQKQGRQRLNQLLLELRAFQREHSASEASSERRQTK